MYIKPFAVRLPATPADVLEHLARGPDAETRRARPRRNPARRFGGAAFGLGERVSGHKNPLRRGSPELLA